MNKIITIRSICEPCKITVDEDVSLQLVMKASQFEYKVCLVCGSHMVRELIRGEVNQVWRVGDSWYPNAPVAEVKEDVITNAGNKLKVQGGI